MKRNIFYFLWGFACLFTSCDDKEWVTSSPTPEMFQIHMAVTNDDGEDLILSSENHLTTGDYAQKFYFDTWNAYLGKIIIQSKEESNMCNFKPVAYNDKMEQYFISLETDARLQREMKDWNKKHHAKYVIVSQALFGDKEEHVIDLDILGITDEVKQTFFIEFAISVDGVEQTVYYPESWEGLYPKDPHGNVRKPYFVLNVDDL